MHWILVIVATILAVYTGYCFLDGFDPESVRGKRVLVTGASAGIGEQLAYHYARLGAHVVITARTESKLQQVVTKCRRLGSTTVHLSYVTADMSDFKQIPLLLKTAVERMGGLDILVLNHITNNKLEMWENRPERLDRLHRKMDINFFSYVHLASHALQYLKGSGGSIVVVGSLSGKKSLPRVIDYSSSKFALEGFFDGLRQELVISGSHVSVTLCTLAGVATESTKTLIADFSYNASWLADPKDAAFSIVKAGIKRVPESYYQHNFVKALLFLKLIAPRTLESFLATE